MELRFGKELKGAKHKVPSPGVAVIFNIVCGVYVEQSTQELSALTREAVSVLPQRDLGVTLVDLG